MAAPGRRSPQFPWAGHLVVLSEFLRDPESRIAHVAWVDIIDHWHLSESGMRPQLGNASTTTHN